jgi:hypothetical protein
LPISQLLSHLEAGEEIGPYHDLFHLLSLPNSSHRLPDDKKTVRKRSIS